MARDSVAGVLVCKAKTRAETRKGPVEAALVAAFLQPPGSAMPLTKPA